jgi:N-acyl-phosphatidylethanolamine-hydrolysing phospholipase D
MPGPLDIEVQRLAHPVPPEHHVLGSKEASGWKSYLQSWNPLAGGASRTPSESGQSGKLSRSSSKSSKNRVNNEQTTFCNPWPSWYKPTPADVWRATEWGEDTDPCLDIGRRQATNPGGKEGSSEKPRSDREYAARLLQVLKPDFSFDSKQKAKVTWLGHAGVLVQLPPLQSGGRPVRCLFDPIFTMRCSPTQLAGPKRLYPPPCTIDDLPEIDVYLLSHNHYDHLDYNTVMDIWKQNKATIRFLVPLGNRIWFVDECGIDADRVTELDWWDSASLTLPSTNQKAANDTSSSLKITCTPAQHNSGRSPSEANTTLWSSWYLTYSSPNQTPCRIFFGGDTGYQFHDSPGWPPAPPQPPKEGQKAPSQPSSNEITPRTVHPCCPAFEEIATRLGTPRILLLPISVGATYDYLRSLSYLPDNLNVIPRHSPGVTAHNHMPPWDAVRVFDVMTASGASDRKDGGASVAEAPIAIAIHWGTFVTEAVEVLKTLGQLEWACMAHGVRFGRAIDGEVKGEKRFIAVDHGESVDL